MHFILSTVGTSILTNLIDRRNPAESNWWNMLRDSANLKPNELAQKTKVVIDTLADRALVELLKNNTKTNRRISAELNGIYGIYGGTLPSNSSDQHWLITTDTAQGQKTGDLIKDFLKNQGFTVSIFTPKGLSTKDTGSFTAGVKELIHWLEQTVPGHRNSYHVIFNLVGGFKSLQGYMNTFGAFYADEVVYIFEAQTADLIKIPRLPIKIDDTVIQNHRVQFALMDAGKLYPIGQLKGIPDTLLEFVEDNGQTYAGLSEWGQLIWNRTKRDLLTGELLDFPRLCYRDSFREDLNGQRDVDSLLALQEELAKAAHSLEESCCNLQQLSSDGLDVKKLQRYDNIYRFRIGDFRVTWSVNNAKDKLILRRYGDRKNVYNSP